MLLRMVEHREVVLRDCGCVSLRSSSIISSHQSKSAGGVDRFAVRSRCDNFIVAEGDSSDGVMRDTMDETRHPGRGE